MDKPIDPHSSDWQNGYIVGSTEATSVDAIEFFRMQAELVELRRQLNLEVWPARNSVRFTLPSVPVSMNGIYQIIYSQRRVELKPEAWKWKRDAKRVMPPWKHDARAFLRIDVHFECPLSTRSGKPRIRDVPNLLKLLIDAVAERYCFDDCLVRFGSWSSEDSEREQVTVTVSEIVEEGRNKL